MSDPNYSFGQYLTAEETLRLAILDLQERILANDGDDADEQDDLITEALGFPEEQRSAVLRMRQIVRTRRQRRKVMFEQRMDILIAALNRVTDA